MPDAPTAADLARALALVDKRAQSYDPKGCGCPCEHCGQARAVFAVARATLALEAEPSPKRGDRQAYRRLDKLTDELAAAIADLKRLATGAQGGEA